jgi:hypothetical protein
MPAPGLGEGGEQCRGIGVAAVPDRHRQRLLAVQLARRRPDEDEPVAERHRAAANRALAVGDEREVLDGSPGGRSRLTSSRLCSVSQLRNSAAEICG